MNSARARAVAGSGAPSSSEARMGSSPAPASRGPTTRRMSAISRSIAMPARPAGRASPSRSAMASIQGGSSSSTRSRPRSLGCASMVSTGTWRSSSTSWGRDGGARRLVRARGVSMAAKGGERAVEGRSEVFERP